MPRSSVSFLHHFAVPDSLLGELTQQLAKATGKPAQVRPRGGRGALRASRVENE